MPLAPHVWREPSVPPCEFLDEDTDTEEFMEACIESSWHHRALLYDEGRVVYTDHCDTNFAELEEHERWTA